MARRKGDAATNAMHAYLEARGLPREAAEARGFAPTRWNRRWPALRLPYHDAEGAVVHEGGEPFARFRLFPDLAEGRARSLQPPEAKFVQPGGTENHLYLDPTVDWEAALGGGQAEVWLTEGEVKAAAACHHGLPTVAVGGVWSWKSKGRRGPIPDLDLFDRRRQLTVVLAFDADVATKPEVRVALRALADELRRRGVKRVQAVQLPDLGDGATGLDDVLAARGAAHVRDLEREDVVPDPAVDALLARYVFAHQVKRFVDTETGQQYDKETFDHVHLQRFQGTKENPKASPTFFKHPDRRVVERPTYAPGRREVLLEEYGERCVNLWQPGSLEPTRADPTPWLDHVATLVPDAAEREVLLDWLAFQVQHPGEKMNWALFLGGAPGAGKDTLLTPLLRAVGVHNYANVSPEDLASGYTDWLVGAQLVVVEEMMNFDRREVMNKLKPLITTPPEKLRVNAKFVPQYYIPNRGNFIFMSNNENALALSQEDRRFFVYWSPVTQPEAERWNEEGYFADLWAWLNDGGDAAALGYLLDRELAADFKPKGRAPWTADKATMVENSRPPLEAHLAQLIEDEEEPFDKDLVELKEVANALPERLHPNPNNVKLALRALGAEQAHGGEKVKLHGGKAVRLWAVRRVATYRAMEPGDLRRAYQGPEHQAAKY